MKRLWWEAANEPGIPHAFIIDQRGRVAAIYHPQIMDSIIEAVVAGRWESDGSMQKHSDDRARAQELSAKIDAAYTRLITAMNAEDWTAVVEAADAGIALGSGATPDFQSVKARALVSHLGNIDEGIPLVEALIKNSTNSFQGLGKLLPLLVDPNVPAERRNLKLADRIAKRLEFHFERENPDYVQYRFVYFPDIAEYYFRIGNLEKARVLQELALATLPERYKDSMGAKMTEALNRYQAPACEGGVCQVPEAAQPAEATCLPLLKPQS